jgi:hypothetical protein
MRIAIGVLVLVLATTTARAEEERVSGTTAGLLAFGGTVVPAALLVCAMNAKAGEDTLRKTCGWAGFGGLVIGPTLGRWYARDATVAGPLLRGAAFAAFIAVARGSEDEPPPGVLTVPIALLFAGAVIYDIAMTSPAVRARNRSVMVVPAVTSGPGVSLVGAF